MPRATLPPLHPGHGPGLVSCSFGKVVLMSRIAAVASCAVLALVVATSSIAKTRRPQFVTLPSTPPSTLTSRSGPQAPGADIIRSWDFESGASGWSKVDLTAQPVYFHVEDFTTGTPGLAPLSGTKSLWCGGRVCQTTELCSYATLPGYGNGWNQRFQSNGLNVSGDVVVDFVMSYDVEPSYDFVYLEYAGNDGVWKTKQTWTGSSGGGVQENLTIDGTDYTGPLKLRIRVVSDDISSDEDGGYDSDGAAEIDDLTVTANNVTVCSEDFETEAQDAQATNDGIWQSMPPPTFGGHSALFDGNTVLQQDPNFTDTTKVWGFFNGSSYTYGCGGHPEQTVVPFGSMVDGLPKYLSNEIHSPSISLSGLVPGDPVLLSFDVYHDLPQDNLIVYRYRVRSRIAGVWQPWQAPTVVFSGDSKTWITFTKDIQPLIVPGAVDFQVAIDVMDMCPLWCGVFGSGACHSQAPLIDNVRITKANTPIGIGVVNQPVDATTGTAPITVTFGRVTEPGLTTLATGSSGPAIPSWITHGNALYYNLASTAATTGDITVCVSYNPDSLSVAEDDLHLMHWDTQMNPARWVDITSSLDTSANVVCGVTDHLSPFVIGTSTVTAVDDNAPGVLALHQNVPNPFNPSTSISYDVPMGGADVTIRIYDVSGRTVRTLVNEHRAAGTYTVSWDGRDLSGAAVASGVYFCKMTAGMFEDSRRMVLLK